jgi:hypothetical protein
MRENDQERGLPSAVGDDNSISASATEKKNYCLGWLYGPTGARSTVKNEAKVH